MKAKTTPYLKELGSLQLFSIVTVSHQADGSCRVKRTLQTEHGEVVGMIGEDRYASRADLPSWIPVEMR